MRKDQRIRRLSLALSEQNRASESAPPAAQTVRSGTPEGSSLAVLDEVDIAATVPRDQRATIGMPRHAVNRAIEDQSCETLSRVGVPHRHGPVPGPRGEPA